MLIGSEAYNFPSIIPILIIQRENNYDVDIENCLPQELGKCLTSFTIVEFCHDNNKQIIMLCFSYDFGLTVRVMFGNFAKLYPSRRFIKFWQNFQTSPVLLISNCTRHCMITHQTSLTAPLNLLHSRALFRNDRMSEKLIKKTMRLVNGIKFGVDILVRMSRNQDAPLP